MVLAPLSPPLRFTTVLPSVPQGPGIGAAWPAYRCGAASTVLALAAHGEACPEATREPHRERAWRRYDVMLAQSFGECAVANRQAPIRQKRTEGRLAHQCEAALVRDG